MQTHFTALMAAYAQEQGFSKKAAAVLADASADEGKYALAFEDTTCILSPYTDATGREYILASAHLEQIDMALFDTAKEVTIAPTLARIFKNHDMLGTPVPILDPEQGLLGFAALRPLQLLSSQQFQDWLNSLEWLCLYAMKNDPLKHPTPQAAPVSVEALTTLFSRAGFSLNGKNLFWRLELGRPVLLFFRPDNGQAVLRSHITNIVPSDPKTMANALNLNTRLDFYASTLCDNDNLWFQTTFYPQIMDAKDLLPVLQQHLDRCQTLAKIIAEDKKQPSRQMGTPLYDITHSLRV